MQNQRVMQFGLMQVMPDTAYEMWQKLEGENITEDELYEPEINIRVGIYYFKSLVIKYENYNLALVAYNAGMGNLDNWIEEGIIMENGEGLDNIPFLETKKYVQRILQNYRIYQELY